MTDTQWLDGYLLSKAGAEHDFKVEWGWDRYMVRGKLFAAICRPEGMKDERYNGHTLVNLKCDHAGRNCSGRSFPTFSPVSTATKRPGTPCCWTGT